MIDERQQMYAQIVNTLLNCPRGQEAEILQTYKEFVDKDLLEIMQQIGTKFHSQGARLLKLAEDLAFNQSRRLLQNILQLVSTSRADKEKVYPFFIEHQDQLNEDFLRHLPRMAVSTFSWCENSEHRQRVAEVFGDFANLIQQFPQGNPWLNVELAIAAYKQILEIFNDKDFPEQWAITQSNLAGALYNRLRCDPLDSREQAVKAFKKALRFYSSDDSLGTWVDGFQERWAITWSNLALVFWRQSEIDQAIHACHLALRALSYEAFPRHWANTQNNLAVILRASCDNQEHTLNQAIHACQSALRFFTFKAFPYEWSMACTNLAAAFYQKGGAEDIEKAIQIHRLVAQKAITQDSFPEHWAITQSYLALAYRDRKRGRPPYNFKKSIQAWQNALKIHQFDTFPHDCRRTSRCLGDLHFKHHDWAEAAGAYEISLKAAEILYQSSLLLKSKANQFAESGNLYRCATYAYTKIGNLQEAVLTLEKSRARGLSESLERDRANLTQLQQSNPELYAQYQDITNQLRNIEAQQRERMISVDRSTLIPDTLRNEVNNLHTALQETIDQICQVPGYENFLTLPKFAEVRQAAQCDRPLVYLVSTSAGSLALFVTPDNIDVIWLNDFTDPKLRELLFGLADDPKISRWFGSYQNFRNDPKTHYLDWCAEIDSVTRQLWEPLMEPLIRHLQTQNIDQAILIPTGFLSLLPLHAAWTEDATKPTRRRYAFDDIHFTYAPNAKSLTAAQGIADRTPADTILAIYNPRNDLPNSEREVKAAIANFHQHTVLRHTEATIEAVRSHLSEASIVHFACHGRAELTEPLTSGLEMSDGRLTLRDILALNLSDHGGIRLAILSACETGLSGIENVDEAISLPTGLLQAGVAGVIASLWAVFDLSTMLLITKFYDLWREQNLPPDQALRQAQIWLRDTTNEEKIAEFKAFIPAIANTRMSPTTAQQLYDELAWESKNDRSFAHPFHWAAFSYTGL